MTTTPLLVPTSTGSAAPPSGAAAIVVNGQVRLPSGLTDLASFRAWSHSGARPEKLDIGYLDGILWIDLTMEQYYTHNLAKGEFHIVLGNLLRQSATGRYSGDGMLLSHAGANLSTEPDGMYVSYDSIRTGRVRPIQGANGGFVELEGTPEMVLEVVSHSSVQKDTVVLPVLYHRAGIPEFWRADVRQELLFEILRWTPTGYVPAQQPDGWWRSEVFDRDFLLTAGTDPLGQPLFTLQHRP